MPTKTWSRYCAWTFTSTHRGSRTGGADDMAESVWKPHTTVAAICSRDQRFLLVREKVDGDIVYNQPAGHLDPGESLLDAVVRETLEETRYRFTPTGLQGVEVLVENILPSVENLIRRVQDKKLKEASGPG